MKYLRYVAVLLAVAGFGTIGCTSYIPHSVQMQAPVQSDTLQIIGSVEGVSNAYWFLGMGPTGDDSLRAATADALSKKGGDALVNVTVDRQITAFPHPAYPLYLNITTRIVGTAIKLKG